MSNVHGRQEATQNTHRSRATTWVFIGFLAVAAYFLIAEHRAHLAGWLPFILLALCPLMHLFHGHGGHGGHGGTPDSGTASDRSDSGGQLPPVHRH